MKPNKPKAAQTCEAIKRLHNTCCVESVQWTSAPHGTFGRRGRKNNTRSNRVSHYDLELNSVSMFF
jgi:hypothetical protein